MVRWRDDDRRSGRGGRRRSWVRTDDIDDEGDRSALATRIGEGRGGAVGLHTDLRVVSGTWRSSWFRSGASCPAPAERRFGETGRATGRLSCPGGKEKA